MGVEDSPRKLRLGYWMSERKMKKSYIAGVEDALSAANFEIVKINLLEDLEAQGPFDAILHKLTDLSALSMQGDQQAELQLTNLENFIDRHPEITFFDPVKRIRPVLDRYKTYCQLAQCEFNHELIFSPTYGLLEENKLAKNIQIVRDAKATFPIVCKPIIAEGCNSAHRMTIVYDENGLSECTFPCVFQSFVNHNAILYKLYYMGDTGHLGVRNSVDNIEKGVSESETRPLHFDSLEVSKHLTIEKSAAIIAQNSDTKPTAEMILCISRAIQKTFGLTLFGVDVIMEEGTGRCAVIDVNVFPGYYGVESYPQLLAKFLRSKMHA